MIHVRIRLYEIEDRWKVYELNVVLAPQSMSIITPPPMPRRKKL